MKSYGAVRLNQMSLAELKNDVFGKHLEEKDALRFAKSFQNALISERGNALQSWFTRNLTQREKKTLEEKTPEFLARMDKSNKEYKKLSETLDKKPEEIADIIARAAYSRDVTEQEVAEITRLTNELKKLKEEPTENLTGLSDNYYKKYNEIYEYIDKINPMSGLDKATRIWGRGALLTSFSSTIFNAASNTVSGALETFVRRVGQRTTYSKHTNDLVIGFIKEAHKVYLMSGIDITRAMVIQDKAREVLGEHFKQVEKVEMKDFVKKPGTFLTYYMQQGVFKYGQGMADIWSSAFAFADSVSLQASRIADEEGLSGDAHKERARQIMLEVFDFKALEREQQKINDGDTSIIIGARTLGVFHAKKATGQDDRIIVRKLLDVRNTFDEITPLNLGTFLDPFLKTPVNYLITSAFEYSPIGFVKAVKEYRGKEEFSTILETLTRAGLGSLFITLLAALLDDDEYMNAYDLAGKDEKIAGNAYNSIVIGGYAISTDMLGFLQAGVTTTLSVSKAKEGEALSASVENLKAYVSKFPIVDNFFALASGAKYKKDDSQIIMEYGSGLLGQLYSRTIPAIIAQMASAVDGVEREKDYTNIFQDIQTKVPIWREELRPKQDPFGEDRFINPITTILFGARVKKVNDTPESRELRDLIKRTSVATEINQIAEYKAVESLYEKGEISKEERDQFVHDAKEAFGHDLSVKINSREYKNILEPEKKSQYLTSDKKKILENVAKGNGLYSRVQAEIKNTKK